MLTFRARVYREWIAETHQFISGLKRAIIISIYTPAKKELDQYFSNTDLTFNNIYIFSFVCAEFFLKLGKLVEPVLDTGYWQRIPNFRTLIKYRKLLKIYSTVVRSITTGCSRAITVYLTICCKQVEKHRGNN